MYISLALKLHVDSMVKTLNKIKINIPSKIHQNDTVSSEYKKVKTDHSKYVNYINHSFIIFVDFFLDI